MKWEIIQMFKNLIIIGRLSLSFKLISSYMIVFFIQICVLNLWFT